LIKLSTEDKTKLANILLEITEKKIPIARLLGQVREYPQFNKLRIETIPWRKEALDKALEGEDMENRTKPIQFSIAMGPS
jgi:hypothetical protein